MAEIVLSDVACCADCASMIGSGCADSVTDLDRWTAGVEATGTAALGNAYMTDSDSDGWFSRYPCEYCGTTDHGTRYPFVVLA